MKLWHDSPPNIQVIKEKYDLNFKSYTGRGPEPEEVNFLNEALEDLKRSREFREDLAQKYELSGNSGLLNM